jgi:hypothetical protein
MIPTLTICLYIGLSRSVLFSCIYLFNLDIPLYGYVCIAVRGMHQTWIHLVAEDRLDRWMRSMSRSGWRWDVVGAGGRGGG